jgi:hypothetical protein
MTLVSIGQLPECDRGTSEKDWMDLASGVSGGAACGISRWQALMGGSRLGLDGCFLALSFDGRLPQGTVTFHEGFKADGRQVAPADG